MTFAKHTFYPHVNSVLMKSPTTWSDRQPLLKKGAMSFMSRKTGNQPSILMKRIGTKLDFYCKKQLETIITIANIHIFKLI